MILQVMLKYCVVPSDQLRSYERNYFVERFEALDDTKQNRNEESTENFLRINLFPFSILYKSTFHESLHISFLN
jgi:hypothetical protein